MAPVSAYHIFTLTLLVITLAATPGQSERLSPEVAAGCWKEIYQVPQCVFHIIKAFVSNGSINDVGVPCCKAFVSLTGDCQVEIFQNSTTVTMIETFCTAIIASADSPPLPPITPSPPAVEPPTQLGDAEFGNDEKRTSAFPWGNVRLV